MKLNPRTQTTQSRQIVFYDGACGFCNLTVSKLIKRDRNRILRYSALQGVTAKERLPPHLRNEENLGTLVYLDADGTLQTKSDAALAVAADLGWPYRSMAGFRILPKSFRDKCYDFVAKRRHRLAATRKCNLPTQEESSLFLP